jgi:TetR/AcrR family transcriptional regulator, transcriptional repressor for nem operon
MARPPSFDRATVLEAVQRQFRKTGYAGTSLDDITAATGLGRGSLYAAFGDKHCLFMQALGEYCDQSEATISAMLDGPDSEALARLRANLIFAAQAPFSDDELLGCMAGKFAVELATQDPEVAERVGTGLRLVQVGLAECICAAQRAGDLDAEADASASAAMMLAVVRGMDVMAKAGYQRDDLVALAGQAFLGLPLTRKGRRTAAAL